jgi:hypothetical protein
MARRAYQAEPNVVAAVDVGGTELLDIVIEVVRRSDARRHLD